MMLWMWLAACSAVAEPDADKTMEQAPVAAPQLTGSTVAIESVNVTDNQTFSLKSALKQGPVVVLFYRGHW